MANVGKGIERLIDFGVAALFAIACAFPAFMLLPDLGRAALGIAALIGVVAFAVALQVLSRIARRPRQAVEFDLAPMPLFPALEPLDLDEVAEELDAAAASALDLEVELPAIGPNSRVVQLFGFPAQATAGELAIRIDRHLARRDDPEAAPADASEELFDALHQLRRSLR